MRCVCKRLMNWINITDFKFGLIYGRQMSEIADSFSKYTKPFGFNFACASIDTIRTHQYEPISKLSSLTSLRIGHQGLTDGRDPTFISALTNLEQLDVHMISTKTLGKLAKLKRLTAAVFTLQDHYSDEDSGEAPLSLPSLETANFKVIQAEDTLPILSDSYRLTRLTIDRITKLPPNYFAALSNLRVLKIYACTSAANDGHYSMLAHIDAPLPNLESLHTNTEISFFENMVQNLTCLYLSCYSTQKSNIRDIEQLTNLQKLTLFGLNEVHQSLDLRRLQQLSSLVLSSATVTSYSYDTLLDNINTHALQQLTISSMEHKQSLSPISKLSNLTDLDLSFPYIGINNPTAIDDIEPILLALKNLTRFQVYGNCTPLIVNDLAKLKTFKNLNLLGPVIDRK